MTTQNQNLIQKNAMEALNQYQSSFAAEKKKEALAIFNSIPMPKEKEEDWRYTEIGKLKLENFEPFESKTAISATKLSEDSIEKGVILTDINTAFEKHPEIAQNYFLKNIKIGKDKFAALNAAHFNNGIFLYVPKNIELEEPIRVNFNFDGKTSIIHNMIIVEPNSKVDFIEEYSNMEMAEEQLNCCVTEVFANQNSKVNFYHLNTWTKNAYNFTNIAGTIERDASISWISGCFGGKLNRLKIDTIFNGQGSQAKNLGIFLGKGKEHVDFTTNMYHNAENTTNEVLVDGILKDESTSV
ncbi:SufD family Fe-S cluster assembly protein, partial [Candidatus Woesearchaeota archaeon]|nr:SufD family Fe-S cluster assembly protein [Candidatus Woesearchaeota archaeon]